MGRGAPREVLGGNRDSGGSPSTATNFMISYEHELRPNHLTIFSAPRWPQRARNYLFSYLRLFRRDLWGTGGLGVACCRMVFCTLKLRMTCSR
jgi:hypothetical protein